MAAWIKKKLNDLTQKIFNGEIDLKALIKSLLIHIVIWTFFCLLFGSIGFKKAKLYILLSFFLNGFVFYGMMINSLKKRAFSLDLIHWFFLFSFMFFAPMVQYLNEAWCWGTSFSDSRIIITNLLLDLWVLVYVWAQRTNVLRIKKEKVMLDSKSQDAFRGIKVNRVFLLIGVLISDLIAVYLFARYGTALFSRATNTAFEFDSVTLTLIASSVVPAFITGVTALAFCNVIPHGKPVDWLLLCMQGVALLIVCFPFGMARFKMAVIYIGLLLIIFPFLRKGSWFLWMMILGLVVIFPVINAFRRISFEEVNLFETIINVLTSILDDFLEGDYDAYTMFMLTQEYVAEKGLSYGMQLVGVLFFFIPRSVWPTKPVGSGQTAAEFFNWGFTNLSCPLPAEGFINFGIIGVILFAFILSKAVKVLDDTFWERNNLGVKVVYIFIVPFLFFMMRGDLLSSFAYLVGFSVPVVLLYNLNALCVKLSRRPIYSQQK